jgi:hypothetical protein
MGEALPGGNPMKCHVEEVKKLLGKLERGESLEV